MEEREKENILAYMSMLRSDKCINYVVICNKVFGCGHAISPKTLVCNSNIKKHQSIIYHIIPFFVRGQWSLHFFYDCLGAIQTEYTTFHIQLQGNIKVRSTRHQKFVDTLCYIQILFQFNFLWGFPDIQSQSKSC